MQKRTKQGHEHLLKGFFSRHRYLSHTYEYSVSGEDLPEENVHKLDGRFWALLLVLIIISVVVIDYVANGLLVAVNTLMSPLFMQQNPTFLEIIGGFLLRKWTLSKSLLLVPTVAAIVIAVLIVLRLKFKTVNIAFGQKGDSRFTTLKEIQEQFKAIPQAGKSFPGYGGVPISHYKNQYYIEDGTYNTEIEGTSRSGKGQTVVLTMLDNISRAQKRSSLVVGDPKGELYAAMSETLKQRGYEVYAYNLIDPTKSMGDDPLGLIKKYYRRGNTEYAFQLINTLTNTIYYEPDAGQNRFFNNSAAEVVNALILVLLETASKTGEWEKVTMSNVAEMLTEVGKVDFKEHKDDFETKNALDELFNSLPPGNLAAKQYVGANFSGEKGKGSILSTVSEKLAVFTMPSIAKLTSRASIDPKSIGFSKYLDFKVDPELTNKKFLIKFLDSNHKKVLGLTTAAVGVNGFVELNFDFKLHSQDILEISYQKQKVQYQMQLSTEPKVHQVELTELGKSTLKVKHIEMNYSDHPMAIFLMLPDFDTSNHVLASLFISSMYAELSYQCSRTAGGKCLWRINWVLDEFGNLPPISNMDQILTVTNGRNMLWHLFVQSDSQLDAKYGKQTAETIRQNCQTKIMIMTTDNASIENFSKSVGNKTVVSRNSDMNDIYNNRSTQASADSERLLTPERISQLLEGETIVLRPLHREDLKHRKIRPFPIFNTKETAMPYAYQFLTQYGIDPSRDINSLDFDSPNAKLNLEDLRIDFSQFMVSKAALAEYQKYQ